jgi:hypothetical protein
LNNRLGREEEEEGEEEDGIWGRFYKAGDVSHPRAILPH